MFATHPLPEERVETLARLAEATPGGVTNEDAWRQKTAQHVPDWLDQEIKRGQHEESLALLTRLVARSPAEPEFVFARGELQRLRARDNDLEAALADYRAAIQIGGEPPQTHRGIGMILRARNQPAEAKASFQRYAELAPAAPDIAMIKTYIEETGK
jgi:predicted Zn-dependent protease